MGISPLPRPAKFGDYIGEVIDEVWVQEDYPSGDYRFFIQRIHWQDGSDSIRFAYYMKPHGNDDSEWHFVNRAPNIEPEHLRELIRRARQNDWFRHWFS
jgi:hypothetical protein